MTVKEQIKQFELMLQTTSVKFNDDEKPDSDTILLFLNVAQVRYIKDKYLSQDTSKDNTLSVGRRAEEFRSLVKGAVVNTLAGGVLTHTVVGSLPSDFLFYIRSDSNITRATLFPIASDTYVPNELANYEDLDMLTTTPFNKPSILKPYFLFRENSSSDGFMVVYDRFTTISDVYITYIRTPKKLVLNVVDANTETTICELAPYMHDEVTALAVKLFEEYKYKLITKEDNKK